MPAVGKEKEKGPKQKKKPGRVPTSCAECRRLKLRCDRNIPCQKCVQRGCGSICPDGVLTPGRNGRLVLAGTEELHDRIDHFTARIRELEGALQALQAQVSGVPHPLLLKDFLEGLPPLSVPSRPSTSSSADPSRSSVQDQRKSSPRTATLTSMEPHPAAITEFSGTLSVSGNGQSSFFGSSARLEFLAHRTANLDTKPPRLSHELFEFACGDHKMRVDGLGKEIFELKPPASEASHLCELYLKHGKVMFSPIPRSELFDEVFMRVYRAASFSDLQPETLALLFMIFAISIHFDPKRSTGNHDASEYYYLAKACLQLSSHRENTLSYIQTLIHAMQYLHFSGSETTMPELRTEYLSHAVRIGYKMGLHLHGVRWDLPEELAQRRSRIFCEIFLLDTWTSFYSGRPPMVSLAFMDRTTPTDYDEGLDTDGNRKPGFHTWTYKYAILLHSIMAVAFGPKPPSYSEVLNLDLRVRNFPVPLRWRPMCEGENTSSPPDIQMVRFLVSFAKESTLLNLHRRYFLTALEETPEHLSTHSFIPSVLAVYRSAWRLMRGLRFIWGFAPELISKMNVAWSQALSAAVVMCLFVTRTPGSHLTDPALNELDLLIELFEEAMPTCRAAGDLITDLRSLRRHACVTAGRPYRNEGYVISPSDLDRLNGKTYLLMTPESSLIHPSSDPIASQHRPVSQQSRPTTSSSPSIKRDPSPLYAASATLTEFPASPLTSTSHPPSSLHTSIPSVIHSFSGNTSTSPLSTKSPRRELHAGTHAPYVHTRSSSSHTHTAVTPAPPGAVAQVSQPISTSPSSSSSTPHATQQTPTPLPPTLTSISASATHMLHPTILQDIIDFTMRGTPASSAAVHYFDFPPQAHLDDASTSVQIPTQQPQSGSITSSRRGTTSATSTSDTHTSAVAGSATPRQRGHSIPGYPAPPHQYHTPTPSYTHTHSHSPMSHVTQSGPIQQESDHRFFQTLESSFHVEYTPQPRSPFTAANFGIGGMHDAGYTPSAMAMHAAYQELVEHLGFH